MNGTPATVRGWGATAGVAAALLSRLGAHVTRTPGADPGHAVEISMPAGRRRIESVASWSDLGSDAHDEASAQASCGLMHVHGRRYGCPRPLPLEVLGTANAVLAVTGLLAEHCRGEPAAAGSGLVHTSADRAAFTLIGHYIAAAHATGGPAQTGVGGPPFQTGEGTWFELESLDAESWAAFWRFLDADPAAVRQGWPPFQFRFSVAVCPLPEPLHAAAARSSWRQVRAAAAIAGVSVCMVRTAADRAAELGVDRGAPWPHPWSELRLPGPEGSAEATSANLPFGAAPKDERPLHGLRVLEIGRRIQGPLATRLLCRLGAEVIRVEPPGGDFMRGMPPMLDDISAVWLSLNRDKGVIEADLRSVGGIEVVRGAVRGCDVLVHNLAEGKAEELGLDARSLAEVNPQLVHVHASGWGGADLADLLPTDFTAQAYSGVAAALNPQGPPRPTLMTVLDTLGGMLAAQAAVVGLVRRQTSGRGGGWRTSLLGAADLLTSTCASSERHRPPARLVPAGDGWVLADDTGLVPDAQHHTDVATLRRRLRYAGHPAVPVLNSLVASSPNHPWHGLLADDPAEIPPPWRFTSMAAVDHVECREGARPTLDRP